MSLPLQHIYDLLHGHFGPQHWWPGDSPFEIMVGAVLTQNTNWTNVSKAIDAIKAADLLSYEGLSSVPIEVIAELIRPSGYYNLKAKRLANLLELIKTEYNDSLEELLSTPLPQLREALLSVKGIGPETADSIILYAAQQPIFVVDAYTYRILARHNLISEDEATDYHEIQALFMDNLPEDHMLFNEFHALLVMTGKEFCKKSNPRCAPCPLGKTLAP